MRISNCWHRSDGHLLGYNQTISTIPQVFCQLVPAEDKKQAGFGGQTQARFPQEGRRMRQGYQGPQDCSGVWRRAKPSGEVVIVCCSREAGRP